MKTCSKCKSSLPKSNFHKRSASKDGLYSYCKTCFKNIRTSYDATYRANHIELCRARIERWRKANLEKVSIQHYPQVARRRALKLNATCKWANEFFIDEIYELAKLRSDVTKRKWHVDHIVPLTSKLVCGLHVENNLRVVPAELNYIKGNRYWPDMS